MPSILDIIQQGRRDLLMGELSMTQAMLDAYALVWGEVERQLLRLEDNLLDADVPIGSDDATLQWLRSQAWYQQLMTSVDAQFARFGTDAQSIVGRSQVGAVHVSQDVSGKVRRWIDDRARTGFSANVRPNVMERWVSVIQPDSPLRGSIERHGIEAAEVIAWRIEGFVAPGAVGQAARHARLLVQAETAHVYHEAEAQAARVAPDVVGLRWITAPNHSYNDVCDGYAEANDHGLGPGGYPPNAVPLMPHPRCACQRALIFREELQVGDYLVARYGGTA